MPGKSLVDEIGAGLVLQARDKNADTAKAPFCKGINQGIDGRGLAAFNARSGRKIRPVICLPAVLR